MDLILWVLRAVAIPASVLFAIAMVLADSREAHAPVVHPCMRDSGEAHAGDIDPNVSIAYV